MPTRPFTRAVQHANAAYLCTCYVWYGNPLVTVKNGQIAIHTMVVFECLN